MFMVKHDDTHVHVCTYEIKKTFDDTYNKGCWINADKVE